MIRSRLDKDEIRRKELVDEIPVVRVKNPVHVTVSDRFGNTQTLCFDAGYENSVDQISFDAPNGSSSIYITRFGIKPHSIYDTPRLGLYELECWDKEFLSEVIRFGSESELQDWLESFFLRLGASISKHSY